MGSAKRPLLLMAVVLAVLSGLFCLWQREYIALPLSDSIALDSPYIVRDYEYTRYILDKQRTRILGVDKRTNVVKTSLPRHEKNADVFCYADDFVVDERGFVYVKEGAWDRNCISREAVLVYDSKGRYVRTVLDTHYSGLVNKHKMLLLSVRGGKLHYALKESDSVIISSFDIQKKTETKRSIPFSNAFDFVGDMAEDSAGNVYLLEKTGKLYRLNDSGDAFSLAWTCASDEFPAWIEASAPNTILYADLYADSVMQLDVQSGEKSLVLSNSGAVTVTPVPFSELQNPLKSNAMFYKQVALLAAFVIFCLSVFCFLVFLLILFFKRKMHVIQRINFYVIIIVIAVSGTITYKLTDEFSKVMKEQMLSQMENMAYSVARTLNPATLDSIQTAADFASEGYREMISSMETVIDTSLETNKNVYCDIFKYDEKRGAYACAYLDQAIGTFFPLTEAEVEEIKSIYDTGEACRSSKNDTSASYIYVSVPVTNTSGRVCGVVSVMMENAVFLSQLSAMRKSVLLGVLVTLIFIWLIMGELLSYILAKSQAKMETQECEARGEVCEKSFPHYYIRLIVFALFASYNMTTTFLPMVVAKGALETFGESVRGFVAALPLSINLFAIGLLALFCEKLIRRFGFKKIIAFGAALSAFGNLLVFFFQTEYLVLFLALALDGTGVGLSTNALYLMVSQIPDAKNRTSGYASYNAAQVSGINFGMLFGAALASSIGRRLVFPLVTIMWLVSALIFILLWRSLGGSSVSESKNEKGGQGSFKRILSFLYRRRVWSYILLVQVPFVLLGSFVYYYLPLYSEMQGLGEVMVAVLMMLYSMFAIYLGDMLTRWVIKRTGSFSSYAAASLSILAILVYALNGTFSSLFLAILLIGLANGFGRSVLQVHFSTLDECENFGVPNAMGIFNFTDFIGQSFGPAVMGFVFLSKNMKMMAIAFSAVLFIVCIIHFLIHNANKRSFQ